MLSILKKIILLIAFNVIAAIAYAGNGIESLSLGGGGGFVGVNTLFWNNFDGLLRYLPPHTTHNAEAFAQLQVRMRNHTTEAKLGFIYRSQEVNYSYRQLDGNNAYVLLKGYGLFAEGTIPHRSKYFSFGLRAEHLWGNFDEATKMELRTNSCIESSKFKQFNFYLIPSLNIPLTQRLDFKVAGMFGFGTIREYPGEDPPTIDLISSYLATQLNLGIIYKLYTFPPRQPRVKAGSANLPVGHLYHL